MQQRRIFKREILEDFAQGDPAETTRLLAVIASVLATFLVLTALSPTPVNLRAQTPSAHCIITPISVETGPTYLCES